jgi:hypothetical protein
MSVAAIIKNSQLLAIAHTNLNSGELVHISFQSAANDSVPEKEKAGVVTGILSRSAEYLKNEFGAVTWAVETRPGMFLVD